MVNARKDYIFIIHYNSLIGEDKYIQMRYKKFSKNAIYLPCSNTKFKAKISFKVLSPRIIEKIEASYYFGFSILNLA